MAPNRFGSDFATNAMLLKSTLVFTIWYFFEKFYCGFALNMGSVNFFAHSLWAEKARQQHFVSSFMFDFEFAFDNSMKFGHKFKKYVSFQGQQGITKTGSGRVVLSAIFVWVSKWTQHPPPSQKKSPPQAHTHARTRVWLADLRIPKFTCNTITDIRSKALFTHNGI